MNAHLWPILNFILVREEDTNLELDQDGKPSGQYQYSKFPRLDRKKDIQNPISKRVTVKNRHISLIVTIAN
jgi:hypothetical protein